MDTFTANLKVTLRLLPITSFFLIRTIRLAINLNIKCGKVWNDKTFGVTGTNQTAPLFGQVRLLVLFIDDIMQCLLEGMSPFLIVIRVHFQIEFFKTLPDRSILHHSHELAVSRHASLY